MVSYALTPAKNGSAPKPSQFRPPWAMRPMFIIGPSAMLTPLPTCSSPIAIPRARRSERFHLHFAQKISLEAHKTKNNVRTYVVAALTPAGKAVAKSAKRTPSGESSRHRPGKSPTGGIFPTQRPFIQPTPVVILTFCSSVKVATLKPNALLPDLDKRRDQVTTTRRV